jgi:two-component system chemotaxis sensor kinase CheA
LGLLTLTHSRRLAADGFGVSEVLEEEHRAALEGARAAVRRMQEMPGLRDVDGVTKLLRLFSIVKVSARYLGNHALREPMAEAEQIVDRLQRGDLRASVQVAHALESALDLVGYAIASDSLARYNAAFSARGLAVQRQLSECTGDSAEEAYASDLELFLNDAVRHVGVCRRALLHMADHPEAPGDAIHEAFRAMHTLKGNAGMMGYADIEGLARAAEHVLDGLRRSELALTGSLTIALMNLVGRVETGLRGPKLDWRAEGEALDWASAEARVLARRTRIGDLLVERNLVSREQVELVSAIKRAPIGEALVMLQLLNTEQLDQALALQRQLRQGDELPLELPHSASRSPAATVQVPRERLNRLSSTVRALLSTLGPESGVTPGLRELATIVARLQHRALSGLLRKMANLARELAEQQGKRIDVIVSGEEVDVAAEVEEVLSDALVHLVRNAVDHGFPTAPAASEGDGLGYCLRLSATATEEEIVVEVSDNGRGIDPTTLIARAVSLGLIAPDQARATPAETALAFVFRPGFSTCEHVTDISGRGVGMDVVRHRVEEVGGTVGLSSRLGAGTWVTLRFPVSRAEVEQDASS